MKNDCLKEVENFEKTGFNYTLSLINGKYKLTVLYALYRHQVIRFNQIERKEYSQIPPKVEYSLSEKGQSFIPILYSLCEWGEKHNTDKERV